MWAKYPTHARCCSCQEQQRACVGYLAKKSSITGRLRGRFRGRLPRRRVPGSPAGKLVAWFTSATARGLGERNNNLRKLGKKFFNQGKSLGRQGLRFSGRVPRCRHCRRRRRRCFAGGGNGSVLGTGVADGPSIFNGCPGNGSVLGTGVADGTGVAVGCSSSSAGSS